MEPKHNRIQPKWGYLILLALITENCFAGSQADTSVKNLPIYQMKKIHLQSRWAKEVGPENALKEYPRPQLKRENWQSLNGIWEYAIVDSTTTFPQTYEGRILVPYPVESALSGVGRTLLPTQRLWYKKIVTFPTLGINERLILNFGAVDWQASIFINGKKVLVHTNGYQSFSIDITDHLRSGNNELLVKVYDPSDHGPNPHGKQVLNPENIYYTPSSGIWQTVWWEKVSATHIKYIKTTPNIDKNNLVLKVNIDEAKSGLLLEATASANGKIITSRKIPLTNNEIQTTLDLSIPNVHLWSPDDPFLYDLSVKVIKGNKTIDEISSYFGMRKINIQKDEKGADRIFLNNKYTFNLGILDQGFWPEGLYTAPTDEALAFDIKAIKAMGFNTIRKHIKIEPDRWYYHADKIGVLVWQDFVNPPPGLQDGSKAIFEKELKEAIDQLNNHPSIITWVIFNERWGVYDQQRLTEWVKSYDPSRIVNGHSGELLYVNNELREPSANPWISSDMTDVHSYPEPRNPPGQAGKARVIGEYGGIGVPVIGHEWDDMQGWGYIQVTPAELKGKYDLMNRSLKKLESEGLSASIYTQPFDVEGEENGLLTYDREIIKIPLSDIRAINKNLVAQTKGFEVDSNFIVATNINIAADNNMYSEMISQYEKGVRDSMLLRRLTVMAIRKKDQSRITQLGNDYIDALTHPFSKENLVFISKITTSTKDKGFAIFNNQREIINEMFGQNYAEYVVKTIINREEIEPNLNKIKSQGWDSIERNISAKYGSLGDELVYGKQMIYHLMVTHDWKNFGKYYVLYFKKALKHPEYQTNNLSWAIFEHVDDPIVLEFAVEVMKHDLENWDKNDPQAYDTYANLLHKLNKSSEAIKWEEKAIQLKASEAEEKVFAETLQKMKSGQPTWPTNN